jgi:hypothetical protein
MRAGWKRTRSPARMGRAAASTTEPFTETSPASMRRRIWEREKPATRAVNH